MTISRQQEIKATLYIMLLQKREENAITLAATANNGRIIEDDYDSEFRFDTRPLPSLQGMAGADGPVVSVVRKERRGVSSLLLQAHCRQRYSHPFSCIIGEEHNLTGSSTWRSG